MNTKNLLAAAATKDGNLGSFTAPSNAFTLKIGDGAEKVGAEAASNFDRILSVALGGFTLVAAIYFLFTLAVAAFTWMGAAGDSSKVQKAKDSMTNGLIGLIILVAVYAIAGVVGTMVGIDILNPGDLLLQLKPAQPTTPTLPVTP